MTLDLTGWEIGPLGIPFHGKADGRAIWTPSRAADCDFSSWGDWEVWEHQEPDEAGGLRPTGSWVAWNSAAEPGLMAQVGFNDRPAMKAREQAELLAVRANEGQPTRIVRANGSWQASWLSFEEAQRRIDASVKQMAAASG